jgi:hypothetical protein
LLGIVIGERSALVAEVSSDRRELAPPHLAAFAFPDQLTLDEPAALGSRFVEFLKQNSFTATSAVFGVPAKQLVAQPVEVPPTDPRTAAQLLWLQTPTQFSDDLGPMAFDFAGETSTERATVVNLIGLQRTYLARILEFAEVAGLTPIAVNATNAALAAATFPHVDGAICMSIRGGVAELALRDGSSTLVLKHLASSTAQPRLLAELRRYAVAKSSESDAAGLGSGTDSGADAGSERGQRKLVLWDDPGLDRDTTAAIAQASGMAIVPGKIRWLDSMAAASAGGAPLALLLPARAGQRLSPDFLHPRITAPNRRALSSPVMAIGAAVAAVLIVAIGAYADVLHIQHQIAATRSDLDGLAPSLATARPFVSQMQFVKTFQPGQSNYLKCLKDLTVSLPEQGQTYLTSFVLEADMKGACIGHSGSEQDVLDLLDKLNANGRFTGLNRKLDARPKGNAADVLFTISFNYAPGA